MTHNLEQTEPLAPVEMLAAAYNKAHPESPILPNELLTDISKFREARKLIEVSQSSPPEHEFAAIELAILTRMAKLGIPQEGSQPKLNEENFSTLFSRQPPDDVTKFLSDLRGRNLFLGLNTNYQFILRGVLGIEPNDTDPKLTPLGQFVQEQWKGKTLIDLAAGTSPWTTASIARQFGAKEYIGIDLSCRKSEFNIRYAGEKLCTNDHMILDDVLHFVSTCPENYGNFHISGLQTHILPEGPEHRQYRSLLVRELFRATIPKGIVLVGENGCSIGGEDFKKAGFKEIGPISEKGIHNVYEVCYFLYQKE